MKDNNQEWLKEIVPKPPSKKFLGLWEYEVPLYPPTDRVGQDTI